MIVNKPANGGLISKDHKLCNQRTIAKMLINKNPLGQVLFSMLEDNEKENVMMIIKDEKYVYD